MRMWDVSSYFRLQKQGEVKGGQNMTWGKKLGENSIIPSTVAHKIPSYKNHCLPTLGKISSLFITRPHHIFQKLLDFLYLYFHYFYIFFLLLTWTLKGRSSGQIEGWPFVQIRSWKTSHHTTRAKNITICKLELPSFTPWCFSGIS